MTSKSTVKTEPVDIVTGSEILAPMFVVYATPMNHNPQSTTKTLVLERGVWRKEQAKPCREWMFRSRLVSSVADLHRVIGEAETADALDEIPGVLMRFGMDTGAVRLGRRTKRELCAVPIPGVSAEGMTHKGWVAAQPIGPNEIGPERFNNLLPIDLDGIPFLASWSEADKLDLSKCAAWVRRGLPEVLQAAGCVVQFTSSHAIKATLHMRLYFLTDRPLSPNEIRAMLGQAAPTLSRVAMGLDHDPGMDVSVWGLNAINYCARPIFQGGDDPIKERTLLVAGSVVVVQPAAHLATEAARLGLDLAARASMGTGDMHPDFPGVDDPSCESAVRDALSGFARNGVGNAKAKGKGGLLRDNRRMGYQAVVWRLMDLGLSQDVAVNRGLSWCHELSPVRPSETNMPDFDGTLIPSHYYANAHGRQSEIGCAWLPENERPGGVDSKYAGGAGSLGVNVSAEEDGDLAEPVDPLEKWSLRFGSFARRGRGARFLYDGLFPNIPGESGSIWAPSSSGKSTFMCGIAAALATRSDFLGVRNRASGPIGVLVVSGESMEDTANSLEALKCRGAMVANSPIMQAPMPEVHLLGKMVADADLEMFAQTGVHIGMVFFDTVTRCFGSVFKERGQASVEANNEVTDILTKLANQSEHKIACWTLDHLGKDVTRGALGSVAKDFNAAAIVTLTKPRKALIGTVCCLKVKGAADDFQPVGFVIEQELLFTETIERGEGEPPETIETTGSIMVPATAPAKRQGISAKQQEVLDAVRTAGGSMTQAALAGAVKMPRSTLKDAIKALIERRLLREAGDKLEIVTAFASEQDFAAVEVEVEAD